MPTTSPHLLIFSGKNREVVAKKPTFSLSQMSRMMLASILPWREKVVAMKPTPEPPLTPPQGKDSGARD